MKAFIETLQNEFAKRQRKNPKYTLRAMARDLGIEATTLSQVLRGKRKMSPSKMREVLMAVGFNNIEAEAIMRMTLTLGTLPRVADAGFITWSETPNPWRTHWGYYAILSAFELADFTAEESWFAQTLNLTANETTSILQCLEQDGLIDRTPQTWQLSKKRVSATSTKDKKSLQTALRENVLKSISFLDGNPDGIASLTQNPNAAVADFSGMTFSVEQSKLPEAMRLIKEFRRSLAEFLCGGDEAFSNDMVYRLNVQLFPLSQPKEKRGPN